MPRKTVEDPSLKAARQARYLAKPRTKQRLKIYNKKQNATPKARAARAAYNKSPKGRIACKLANLRCLKMKRDFVQAEKLKRGCVDCGYRANAAAMDFDHVRGTKKFVLSNFSQSLAAIKKEMAKCEVRCALCHRIKTHADSLKRFLKRSARLKANKERSEEEGRLRRRIDSAARS